ncbi:hypothetical protein DPMN_014799 [Dreissena polymorpha]|uniref:Uncharacterized protein n=1 Tax=Dreissena polymorpha TaxID=45954 RepID=A0A9D4NCG1_DREPO|nr:hypothetical protein DPMN_010742 [Dreissena polymorpha]KAH3890712.1 hypothetical protein DPMN_014799 [Dreissena polymorpha]
MSWPLLQLTITNMFVGLPVRTNAKPTCKCNPARKIPDHHGDLTRDLPVPNQADTLPRRHRI